MKKQTLMLMTAIIITVAVLALTAGMTLLHISAVGESPLEDRTSVPEVVQEDTAADDQSDSAADTSDVCEETPEEEVPEEEAPEADISASQEDSAPNGFEYPEYEYVAGDAREVYVGGGEDVSKGVVIDVYSHQTGKLVGQLAFRSQEIVAYISSLVRETFDPAKELWIDRDAEVCQNLPMGDYRIEVYAGTWFSYTYGNGDMFELTQCTLTFAGGEKLNGYIDYLIADLIAGIESGEVAPPAPEMAVSKLLYRGLEGYWEGYYVEEINHYVPAAGRFNERFPYVAE